MGSAGIRLCDIETRESDNNWLIRKVAMTGSGVPYLDGMMLMNVLDSMFRVELLEHSTQGK